MFIVVTVVFFVLRVIGDPARLLLSPEGTMEDLERLRSALGLDQPVLVQYYNYLKGIITLDFGSSLRYNQPVLELIGNHLPKTLLLSGTSLLIAIPLSLLFGIQRHGQLEDVLFLFRPAKPLQFFGRRL